MYINYSAVETSLLITWVMRDRIGNAGIGFEFKYVVCKKHFKSTRHEGWNI